MSDVNALSDAVRVAAGRVSHADTGEAYTAAQRELERATAARDAAISQASDD